MIIVSWDVGVKNLAYCVLEYQANSDKQPVIKILDWDVINLIEDQIMDLSCCGELKCKKGDDVSQHCDKKASYYLCTPTKSKPYGFCRTHLSQSCKYWSDAQTNRLFKETNSANASANTCQYIHKNNNVCNKISKRYYVDNNNNNKDNKIYYCQTHYKTALGKKIKQYSPILIKNIIVQKYPTSQLQLTLVKKLDELAKHFADLGVEQIIIENQPSHKNPKMKSISNTLFDYFMIRGYIDKIHNLNINLVRFMCPSNKLKVNNDNTLQVFKASNNDEKQKYKLTKALSVQYTKQLLADDEEHLEYLDIFKNKQDDICDAYLQGRYYLEFILNKKPTVKSKTSNVKSGSKSTRSVNNKPRIISL